MYFKFSFIFVSLFCLHTFSEAHAQSADTCDGVTAISRISDIVEGGSIAGVKAAAAAHEAWYRSHGSNDNHQLVIDIYDYETSQLVADQVMSLHVNPPTDETLDDKKGDDAWKSFLGLYQKNSKIVSEHLVCLPSGLADHLFKK